MNAIKINKLRIHLLGKLTFRLNEEPIRWFPTDRVRALLLILAMSPTLTEQRSTLANLLWSEVNDKSARRNLRRCLLRLRKVVGDDVVVATRQTIGLVSAESDYNTFQALTQSNNHNDWQTAVDLIQSEMVEGFVLKNAPLFDDWITAQRLAATQQQRDLLIKLLALETEDGLARLRYAQKWVAIAPYDDAAHRAIMSAHATQGNTA
ncbi:MAG: hypothetical protein KAG89_22640, partial [Fulvimarina manganoxydans]|uniref:AfsR/SARP family transcriptional regulator n=1 Tax=Fulvimarina manganoxydans TaxID=937218 RepID=UPI002355C344